MKTILNNDSEIAASLLDKGELVAIPTETVYGLAAKYSDAKAIASVFKVKNRPEYDPLIIHASSIKMIETYLVSEFPPLAYKLAKAFWPGPLTIVLPKKADVSNLITAGLDTIGVRIPDHPLVLDLIKKLNYPLAAPSANPFGYISPTSPQHVKAQLGGKISMILDGGNCKIGLESTIVRVENNSITVLRNGAIGLNELKLFSDEITFQTHSSSKPNAPGMLESHYAPKKKLYYSDNKEYGKFKPEEIGMIVFRTYSNLLPKENQIVLSPEGSLEIAARNLYSALREMDQSHFKIILTESFPQEGIGIAINDRLNRAVTRK